MQTRLFEQGTGDEAEQGQVWDDFLERSAGMDDVEQVGEDCQVGDVEKEKRMAMVSVR